jgi:signal transduction histidine kinase
MKELFVLRRPTKRQWIAGIIFFGVYLATSMLGARFFTPPAVVTAAPGIALAALVLEGVTLWPALYLGAIASYLFTHGGNVQFFVLILLPIANTAQAVVAAMLLKKSKFDPMFGHIRDGLAIFIIGIVSAIIAPAIGMLAYILNQHFFGTAIPPLTLGSWWGGGVMSIVVASPFLIRWLYHPSFSRTRAQVREIVLAFGLLLIIGIALFFTPVTQVGDISLVYFLLIPLFWIAIRLGPRFMTLAIELIGVMGIGSVYFGTSAAPAGTIGERVFQMQILIIVLAGIFLVLVSSEEERKEALTDTRSQLAKLEDDFGLVSSQERSKSEFLAILSHELRNPLAPLVSSLEFLRLKGSVSNEDMPILDEMDERIKIIKRLLDDILDITRISQNKLRLQKEPRELQKIVARAIHSVEKRFGEQGQIIVTDMEGQPIRLEVDAVRIEQVITNLLNNASKFTDRGGHIFISVRQQGLTAEVRIKDDGIGIDPTMLHRIFEPFLQIEGRYGNDGLGIGLSLAKQLIEMHEGVIEAKSEGTGRGSEFVVRLPLALAPSPLSPPAPAQKDPVRTARTAHPAPLPRTNRAHRILVVDDNAKAAQGIGKLLQLMGYQVDYAYSGADAVRQAADVHPDSIILDIGLPDMDGCEAATIIRNRLGFPGMLIALTGYGQDEDKEKSYAAGFNYHLTKPIGIADLQKILQPTANS